MSLDDDTWIFPRAYLRADGDPENNCVRIIDIVLRASYIWNKLLRITG